MEDEGKIPPDPAPRNLALLSSNHLGAVHKSLGPWGGKSGFQDLRRGDAQKASLQASVNIDIFEMT
jgi:hypothetical protein